VDEMGGSYGTSEDLGVDGKIILECLLLLLLLLLLPNRG
jgi:hypothetical protein